MSAQTELPERSNLSPIFSGWSPGPILNFSFLIRIAGKSPYFTHLDNCFFDFLSWGLGRLLVCLHCTDSDLMIQAAPACKSVPGLEPLKTCSLQACKRLDSLPCSYFYMVICMTESSCCVRRLTYQANISLHKSIGLHISPQTEQYLYMPQHWKSRCPLILNTQLMLCHYLTGNLMHSGHYNQATLLNGHFSSK